MSWINGPCLGGDEPEERDDEGMMESSHHAGWRPVMANSGTHWTHWVPLNPGRFDRSRGEQDAE